MKHINILATTLFLFAMAACSGMQDDIKEYLDEGETIFVGKLDSIVVHPGKNRIMIEAEMPYGMTQTKCLFTWLNPAGKTESKEFEIEREIVEDKFEFYFEPLEEGQHDFKIITKDSRGNSSIIVDAGGYSFGEVYQSTLENRQIASLEKSDQDAIIKWLPINNDHVRTCEIEYEKADGTIGKIEALKADYTTTLPAFKPQGELKWNTTYLPDSIAIDKFYTDMEMRKLPQ